jgi:hypothetical protein
VADADFALSHLVGIRKIMDWHLEYLNSESGVIEALPFWNFVDWPKEWAWDTELCSGGIPAGAADDVSSIINLQFLYAALELADLFEHGGDAAYADYLRKRAAEINTNTKRLCWDSDKGLLADSPDFKQVS